MRRMGAPGRVRAARDGHGRAPGREGAAGVDERAPRRLAARPVRLVPDPRGTPFTFWYALVLLGTSVYARYGDPATVSALLRGSSTDAAHLATVPLLVLVASALWIAGGLASPYALGFVLVLTALERRVGGLRVAAVFLGGHVAATLATEIPVGLWVMAGRLPETSLHRLDYGISFGLLACVGALTALFRPLPAAVVLAGVSALLVLDLLAYEDPLSNWGHPLALLSGLASGPLVRRRRRYRELRRSQEREGMRETSEERDVREGRRMPTGQRMPEGPESRGVPERSRIPEAPEAPEAPEERVGCEARRSAVRDPQASGAGAGGRASAEDGPTGV